MPSPQRSALRRTAAALAEDLVQARKAGGIWKASEADLAATIDFLSIAGVSRLETPLGRARDLLVTYIHRGCQTSEKNSLDDKTALAAAASLRELLLRPATDRRIVQTIRREAAKAVGQTVSPDAVRHRENTIIQAIAAEVFADLVARQLNDPQTVEAAIHRLVPIASDLRQDLHDLLCVTYMGQLPRSPRERRVIEGTAHEVVINLGRLLRTAQQLADLGLRTPNLTAAEYRFAHRARNLSETIFDEYEDGEYMLELLREVALDRSMRAIDRMLADERGRAVYERFNNWMQSCFPTCAFERSTEMTKMCEPHAVVTMLYRLELDYIEQGFSELNVPGNFPLMHHRLPPAD